MRAAWLLVFALACSPPEPSRQDASPEEPTAMLIAIAGQSNALGSALVNDVTSTTGLATLYPNVTLVQRMAGNVSTDPPVLTDIAAASLGPRYIALEDGSPLANGRMGIELSLGRVLDVHVPARDIKIAKFALGGSGLEEHWKPTATYPTVGPNICAQFVSWIQAQEVALEAKLTVVIWIQGNNDAGNAAEAAAYAANMGALLTEWRRYFPAVPLVFDQLHPGMSGAHNATVRAQQASFAATYAGRGVRMLNVDDLELRDDSHFTANSFVTLGERFAKAVEDVMPTTTYAAIRDEQARLIETITPTSASQVKFQREEGRMDFRQWAQANPNACFRRFSIMGSNRFEGPLVSNTDIETQRTDTIITIAYPKQYAKYGAENIRDLQDMVEEDIVSIDDTIGHRGQNNFLGGQSFCNRTDDAPVDDGGAVWFVTLTFETEFHRAV